MIQFPYNPGGHAPYAKPAMRHLVKLPFLALVDGSADLMVGDIHQEIDGRFEHVRDFGRVGFGLEIGGQNPTTGVMRNMVPVT